MSRKPYPSDLTDAQWAILAPLLPSAKAAGRPRTTDLREVVDATLYVVRTGCAWRMLPHDFPPHGTVWYYYWTWRQNGLLTRIHDALRTRVRVADGRDPHPSAGCLDSQTVKTAERGGEVGYDAGKKTKGRQRHLLVDTLGLIHGLVVHRASIQDPAGGRLVLTPLLGKTARWRRIWVDGRYAGGLEAWALAEGGWTLEVVRRPSDATGWVTLPKRWIVERTFARLGKCRRLGKDYEATTESSEAMIRLAMIHLMIRRLAPS